jgi:hypothetical protein
VAPLYCHNTEYGYIYLLHLSHPLAVNETDLIPMSAVLESRNLTLGGLGAIFAARDNTIQSPLDPIRPLTGSAGSAFKRPACSRSGLIPWKCFTGRGQKVAI